MRRQLPIPYSVAIGTVFVAVIEISQIFIYTRFAKTTDVIIGALGIWIGVLWARRSTTLPTTTAAHAGGALSNCLWTLGVLFYSAFLCTTFWWPLEMIDDRQLILTRLEGFWRVPFAALYRGSEFNAATQLVRKLLHFALLGAAVGHLVQRFSLPGYARRWWYLISACYGIGLGVMIELGQVFFPPHVCDVTDVLIYSCGVIVGMRVCIRFQRGSSGQGPNFVLRSRAPSSRQNDTRRHPVTKALTLGGVLLLVCFVAWGTMRVVMTNRDKINISFEDSVGAVLYRQPSVQSSPEAEHDRKSISAHISDAFDGRSTSYEISAKWPAIGVQGPIGCDSKPKKVQRLIINKPGVYENHLVDGDGSNRTLVKISADGVILRHCEIRNGTHNAVTVYADNVMIESCRIHHVFKGTFQKQRDAHGITGRPTNLIIRNCEIYQLSGDGIQFDPDRGPWDRVLVENCTIWTAPLDADAAGFKRGERPGENGVDTKQRKSNPRSRMFIRNCVFYGWGEGQIANQAALNLKDNVDVRVENCAFRNNDICFRLRGEASARRGGALVTIQRCAVYDSLLAARMEDRISHLKIRRLGIGDGVRQKYYIDKGKIGPGYENTGEFKPPTFEAVIRDGVPAATRRYPAKDR
jgi:VanZ family protein